MIRGEALYSHRSAWFVCFPGVTTQDRLTNFKGPGRDGTLGQCERAMAERCLLLFSALAEIGIDDRERLMTAGAAARATMRDDESATDEQVQCAALAALGTEGVVSVAVDGGMSASREEESPTAGAAARATMRDVESATDEQVQCAALAALGTEGVVLVAVDGGMSASREEESPEFEDCAGGTREVLEGRFESFFAELVVAQSMHEVKVKVEQEPPMPPPQQDPPPPSSVLAPMNEKASVKVDDPALAGGAHCIGYAHLC